MLKRIISYFAIKSHNVHVQLFCATLYGLVSIFGIKGTIMIIMKARKLSNVSKVSNRVTAQRTK